MQFAVMAVVCAAVGGAAFADATIADDQTDGNGALISGSEDFSMTDWSAHVDYAVYAPGNYPTGDFPPEEFEDHYTYAYQVFNDSSSLVALSSFNVGLAEDSGAANITFDIFYGVPGGISPGFSWLVGVPPGPGSAQWIVVQWTPGTHSTVLLFSSPNTYTFDSATLVDGGEGNTQLLPTPLPEPAVLFLLCGGVLPVLLKKYRRKARAKV
ncbi:MAG: hypothetical protein KAV00_02250 [Phycisphaerae bacterium]|nr:hypothetical protein [Phycisphaerae bacterium]